MLKEFIEANIYLKLMEYKINRINISINDKSFSIISNLMEDLVKSKKIEGFRIKSKIDNNSLDYINYVTYTHYENDNLLISEIYLKYNSKDWKSVIRNYKINNLVK